VSGQRSRVRRSAGKLYGHAGGAQRRTDGSAHTGTAAAEEGAQIIVRIAPLGPDGPTGDASTRDGHIGCTGLTANDEDSLAGYRELARVLLRACARTAALRTRTTAPGVAYKSARLR
jgi:hypothetical protein